MLLDNPLNVSHLGLGENAQIKYITSSGQSNNYLKPIAQVKVTNRQLQSINQSSENALPAIRLSKVYSFKISSIVCKSFLNLCITLSKPTCLDSICTLYAAMRLYVNLIYSKTAPSSMLVLGNNVKQEVV